MIKRIRRVLVVDDNRDIRQYIRQILTEDKCTVWTAGSGEEALRVMELCSDTPIPLIITDLSLPGMDGLTLCRRLRKADPMRNIIAITGYPSIFDLLECRQQGFDDYLVKPIRKAVLLAAVENCFKRLFYWREVYQHDITNR